jgi:hypothetical protein
MNKVTWLVATVLGGAVMVISSIGNGQQKERAKGNDAANVPTTVWVMVLPYGGQHNECCGTVGFFVIDKNRTISFGPKVKRVIEVLSVVTRTTGVEFLIEDNLALYQDFCVWEPKPREEVRIISKAMNEITSGLEAARDASVYSDLRDSDPKRKERKVLLRTAWITTADGERGGVRSVISFVLAPQVESVQSWIKDITRSTRPQSREDLGPTELLKKHLLAKGVHPIECSIDQVLDCIWVQIDRSELSRLEVVLGNGKPCQ